MHGLSATVYFDTLHLESHSEVCSIRILQMLPKKGSGTHTSLTPPVIFCCALQVNQITAFIDGSNVYGSDVSTARRLRLGRRGRLRVTRLESEDLLPLAPEECADHSKRQYCFAAGNKEPLSCPDKLFSLFSIQSSDLTRCLFRSKAFT